MPEIIQPGRITVPCKGKNCNAVLEIKAENLTGGYPNADGYGTGSMGNFEPAIICSACGTVNYLDDLSEGMEQIALNQYTNLKRNVPPAMVISGEFKITKTCRKCNTQAIFRRNEIFAEEFGGTGRDSGTIELLVICPICRNKIVVSGLSGIVGQEARERSGIK